MSLEVTYLQEKRVYDRNPQATCNYKSVGYHKSTVGRRIAKCDNGDPAHRSSFVGKDLNGGQMGGPFAATPPPGALRILVHEAATVWSSEEIGSKVIMANDLASAFIEAPYLKNDCIDNPKEDRTEPYMRHDKVGHLRMSLYGTRGAAMDWQWQ